MLTPLLLTLAALPAADVKTYDVEAVKDVSYYDGPDRHKVKHNLDLYLPKGAKDFPVLFFVHGGAWVQGDKDFLGVYSTFAKAFAKQGIGVVVTNYRLSPSVKHPEHAKDVARAVAWTVANIAKRGGKADNLFLCGHSAGAHLVALVTADPAYLAEHKLTTACVKGVIPISGPLEFRAGFLPAVFGDNREVTAKASPHVHARKDMPPYLLLYADNDLKGCDKGPNETFHKAVVAKGNKCEIVEVAKSNHMSIFLDAKKPESKVYQAILAFVRK